MNKLKRYLIALNEAQKQDGTGVIYLAKSKKEAESACFIDFKNSGIKTTEITNSFIFCDKPSRLAMQSIRESE